MFQTTIWTVSCMLVVTFRLWISQNLRLIFFNGFQHREGKTGTLYNYELWSRTDSGNNSDYRPNSYEVTYNGTLVLEPCDLAHVSDGNKVEGEIGNQPNTCWSKEAEALFGQTGVFPTIAPKFNCGRWGLSKANAVGWFTMIWVELVSSLSQQTVLCVPF